MQRRSFMQILGAFGMIPALPASALASTVSTTKVAGIYNHHMFGHALAHLRTKGVVSIAEFQKALHLTASQAEAIIGEFSRSGLISNEYLLSGSLNAVRPNWLPSLSTPSLPSVNAGLKDAPNPIKRVEDLNGWLEDNASFEQPLTHETEDEAA